jgi:hypothetical protein
MSLEALLPRPVMYFPCFHHVLELVLGSIIQTRWPTSGPTDKIFAWFSKAWPALRERMKEIQEKGENSQEMVAVKHDITRQLRSRLLLLLRVLQPMRQEKGANDVGLESEAELGFDLDDEPVVELGHEPDQDMDAKAEDGPGTAPEPEDRPSVGQEEARKRIPQGDYLESLRMVMVSCAMELI